MHRRSRRPLADGRVLPGARSGRLKLRVFDSQWRGAGELIFYERPDTLAAKTSRYYRVPVPDPVALDQALTAALGTAGRVDKSRLVYHTGQARIHIDNVAGLGDFLEIEVVLKPEQSVDEGRALMDQLVTLLGIESSDLVDVAYTDLLGKTKPDG